MNFKELFPVKKPIIGMIHLAGFSGKRAVLSRALQELAIYQENGVDGAIIEDYHGTADDVESAVKESSKFNIKRGVNLLRSPYSSFGFKKDGISFVQFDSVQTSDLNLEAYDRLRATYPDIAVLGGIGFKYTSPTGNPLAQDLREGGSRCEAIVTTGSGTGIETPLEKLAQYKALLRDFPLIVGAGVNAKNVSEQLKIADGAIVGSSFKFQNNTQYPVDAIRVRDFMDIVRSLRAS